jgi:hypothetical protein
VQIGVALSLYSTGITVCVGLLSHDLVTVPLRREILEFIVDHGRLLARVALLVRAVTFL